MKKPTPQTMGSHLLDLATSLLVQAGFLIIAWVYSSLFYQCIFNAKEAKLFGDHTKPKPPSHVPTDPIHLIILRM